MGRDRMNCNFPQILIQNSSAVNVHTVQGYMTYSMSDLLQLMVAQSSSDLHIRDNKTFRIQSDIQTGAKFGIVTLDSYLMEKYAAAFISREEVVNKPQDPTTIIQKQRLGERSAPRLASQAVTNILWLDVERYSIPIRRSVAAKYADETTEA